MASRTRKRWCANGGVLVRLTLTLSGLCAGQCTNIGLMTMTTTTTTRVSTTETETTMTTGSRECIEGVRTMSKGEVKLAVIAPGDPHHEQSLQRVLPAVLLAVKYVSSPRGPLPGWNIKVDYRDSYCSSTYGPLAAFDFYINQTAGRTMFISFTFSFLLLFALFSLFLLILFTFYFPWLLFFISDVIERCGIPTSYTSRNFILKNYRNLL